MTTTSPLNDERAVSRLRVDDDIVLASMPFERSTSA